ncbi:MAG: urease accessory protein UreF [Chromatiaceae bacterium]|nr:MAG: urease accessory protein UreF [Chromatiaceae bacterium]
MPTAHAGAVPVHPTATADDRSARPTAVADTAIAGLPLLRLLQLVSPSLPVGGFTYSQGIEWAREAGWLCDAGQLAAWLDEQLHRGLARVDLPLLLRLQAAAAAADEHALATWIACLLAQRETAELRAEEAQRGRALADLLASLGIVAAVAPADAAERWQQLLGRSQLAGFAAAAQHWQIAPATALAGYAWAWLENLTLAAVKILPLGQTQGQRLLLDLAAGIPAAVAQAQRLAASEIGACSPALAIASSCHEEQYTRLFRS